MDTKAFNEKNFGESRAVCERIEREDGGGDYKTEANKLHNQLNASERKSERRLRQIDHLESVIRNRNAELKKRKQLVHELRNEVRKLGKQVSDLSAERENGGNCVVLTDRERQILDMWPRFEDGEPVWFGDETDRIVGKVITIQLGACLVSFWNDSDNRVYMDYGERVKRPAPEVLDADGVEIHVGDTVYELRTGEEYKVERVFSGATDPDFPDHTIRCNKVADCITHVFKPDQLTHRRIVLDADGVEIKVGDTVWIISECTETPGEPYRVKGINKYGEVLLDFHFERSTGMKGEYLTHTGPDSWERLEEDAAKDECDYFGFSDKECTEGDCCPACDDSPDCHRAKIRDLVRRAKALAGVGE